MTTDHPTSVQRADAGDAGVVAQLLHEFNREFDETTPPVAELTARIALLLRGKDTVILLVGDNPDGLAVLRFREAIWTPASSATSRSSTSLPPNAGTGSEGR